LWSGALQASLGLPLGAMLPVLAMVEALCEGGRNLVSYLTAAALAAAATDALPLPQAVPAGSAPSGAALRLVVPRREAWLGLTLLGAALLFMFCAGLGVGLRNVLLTAL
jgi:aerobic C4-dicarboxylate transport protein